MNDSTVVNIDAARERRCESCGAPADVELHDESLWCQGCHEVALDLGYDNDEGTVVR